MGILNRGTKNIIIITSGVFVLQILVGRVYPEYIKYFALIPKLVWKGYVWQLFTYMFLHGGIWHLALNMYALFLFGNDIEYYWGTKEFYKFYFITGIGAGIIYAILRFHSYIPVIGASGAIFGVLLAYGLYFPERRLMIFPLFIPIKAIHLVYIFGAIEFLSIFTHDNIAHLAHLAGLLVGYLYIRWKRRRLY